jgi:hypothetical protein
MAVVRRMRNTGVLPHWGRDVDTESGTGILTSHDGGCFRGVWAPAV